MQEQRVALTVLASAAAVEPGGEVDVGFLFEIEPGWHTYAPAQNDTGPAARVAWEVRGAEGVEFGPLRWPTGRRYTQPGEILDHVYEDEAFVVQTVRVPAGVPSGTVLHLTAEIEWLVCDAALCVPEWKTVTLELPVRAGGGEATHSAAFDSARTQRARPMPADGSSGISLTWSGGDTLSIRSDAGLPMVFMPLDGSPRVADLLAAGSSDDGRLSLSFEGGEAGGPVRGWLVVGREGTPNRAVWLVETPYGGDGSASGGAG